MSEEDREPDEGYSRLSNLLIMSVPDEGYFRLSNLLIMSVPDEGYSRLSNLLMRKIGLTMSEEDRVNYV
jgi:hypothetical protein